MTDRLSVLWTTKSALGSDQRRAGDLDVYVLSRPYVVLSNQSPGLIIAWNPAGRALNAPGLLVW